MKNALLFLSFLIIFSQLTTLVFAGVTFHPKDTLISMFKSLCDAYPTQASYSVIGHSYENRDIYIFRIGNPNGGSVMWDGSMHGWEDIGSEVEYSIVNWLLTSGTPEAQRILERNYILFVPIINMDSTERENRDFAQDSFGVDLNRNFVTGFNYIAPANTGYPNSFHGASAASEPETQAMRSAFQTYLPQIYLNGHYGGGPSLTYGTNDALTNTIRTRILQLEPDFATYWTMGSGGSVGNGMIGGDAKAFGANVWQWEMASDTLPVTDWQSQGKPRADAYMHYSHSLSLVQSWFFPRVLLAFRAMAEAIEVVPSSPTCSVSDITESSSYAFSSGTSLWYNSASGSSFTVNVTASGGSGVSNVSFPSTVSVGGGDLTAPYSWTYNWDGSDTYSSTATITAYDTTGQTGTCSFILTRDINASTTSSSIAGNYVITLSGADNPGGSGYDKTYYCINTTNTCTPTTQYSSPIAYSCSDNCYVRYYSTDKVSNSESVKSTQFGSGSVSKELVLNYNFNESAGSVTHDLSSFGNNGNINSATWVSGRHGYGMAFDGINDFIDIEYGKLDYPVVTVCAWFKVNTGSTDQRIVTVGNEAINKWVLTVTKTNYLVMSNRTASHATSSSNGRVDDGNWHYACGTSSPEHVYVDGVLQSSTVTDSWSFENNAKIGSRGTSLHFNGTIDEIRIYNFALSASEIASLYADESKNYLSGRLTDKSGSPVQAVVSSGSIANITDSNGNYFLRIPSGMCDVQYNISNFYVKASLNMVQDVNNLINYVTQSQNKVSFTVDSQAQTVQTYSATKPSRVLADFYVLTEVSSLQSLAENTWFYNSTGKRLYVKTGSLPILSMLHVSGTKIYDGYGNEVFLKGVTIDKNEKMKLYNSTGDANPGDSTWFNVTDVQEIKQFGGNDLELHGILLKSIMPTRDVINEQFFVDWIDKWVLWCEQNQIYCIVNIGGFEYRSYGKTFPDWLWQGIPGYPDYPTPIDTTTAGVFIRDFFDTDNQIQEINRQAFIDAWEFIANRYKNNNYVLFSIMNEPLATTDMINRSNSQHLGLTYSILMERVIDGIRSTGAQQIIFIDKPYVWWLADVQPLNRDNIVWEDHLYVSSGFNISQWKSTMDTYVQKYTADFGKPFFVGEYGVDPPLAVADWQNAISQEVVYLNTKPIAGRQWHQWGYLEGEYYDFVYNYFTPTESDWIIQNTLG